MPRLIAEVASASGRPPGLNALRCMRRRRRVEAIARQLRGGDSSVPFQMCARLCSMSEAERSRAPDRRRDAGRPPGGFWQEQRLGNAADS